MIEKDIETLRRLVLEIHDKLSMHTWIQDGEPFFTNKELHDVYKCKKGCKIDHLEWSVRCECGATSKATERDYLSAAPKGRYDGY